MRGLMASYFQVARVAIERTAARSKFIGDAVMAVFGVDGA
jgi:class 3 adenylate cyclase